MKLPSISVSLISLCLIGLTTACGLLPAEETTSAPDFHIKPPKDGTEAEAWARADAKKMEQSTIGTSEVTVVSPFGATASTKENNPHVARYWQALFEELGGVGLEEI